MFAVASPLKVLLIEDNAADARMVHELLREVAPGAVVLTHVSRMEQAVNCLRAEGFNAILLDLGLPDSDGLETFGAARAESREMPIVVLTGLLDEEMAVTAVREGAQDYLVKDRVDGAALYQSIRYAIERHRSATALSESEARFRALTEASFDGIIVSDRGVIREANRGFAEMFGYAVHEVLGLPIDVFVDEESREEVARRIRDRIDGTYEFTARRRDGRQLLLESTSRTLDIGTGGNRISAFRDLTEKRLLERQFRQAQKMEAVGRLAGGIAHDFNNLLTVIGSYSSFLLSEVDQSDAKWADLDQIRRASASAAVLTRQLLAFSRQQVLVPKILDLNEVVINAEQMLRRTIGEDVDLVVSCGADLGRVHADAGQIEQVIMNLVVNARDAMLDGGKLTIETANADLSDDYVRDHLSARPGRYVMLAVRDSGTGMDAETLTHIFEPFFSTKETGKGTGLGLATVYGIVKQSGGFVWVDSEPGNGATFNVYLPRVDAVHAHLESVPALRPQRGHETVLLVEDAEAVRSVVRQILERWGYTIIEASTPQMALRMSAEHRGSIDLLLTDVVMPDMGGRRLAEELVSLRPDLKVLYMSGYTDDAIVRHLVLDGDVAFLPKPFSPDALVHAIRSVLDADDEGTAT